MLKLVKNIFCLFLVLGSNLAVTSQSSKLAVLSHDDKERNAKIDQIIPGNEEIFKSSNMIYAVKPAYPECMNNPEDIIFSTPPVKSGYLANMIRKSYIAPMKVFKQESGFVVKTAEDLFEGDFIGMYAGNVVKNLMHPLLPLYSRPSVMRHKSKSEEAYMIDASWCGNEIRFIRKAHSGSNCKLVDVLGEDDRVHAVCIATKYISQFKELVVQDIEE